MNERSRVLATIGGLLLSLCLVSAAAAQNKDDVFRGKLFPPNVILENQADLKLSKEQFTKIRATVVEVQSSVAEYEWDMREAYLNIMAELDKTPVSEARLLEHVNSALQAENQVKKHQVTMLVRLKNLLTADQVATLTALVSK